MPVALRSAGSYFDHTVVRHSGGSVWGRGRATRPMRVFAMSFGDVDRRGRALLVHWRRPRLDAVGGPRRPPPPGSSILLEAPCRPGRVAVVRFIASGRIEP